MSDGDLDVKTNEDGTPVEDPGTDKDGWDKEKQFRDELSAANKRLEEKDSQINGMQSQLANAEAAQAETQAKIAELEKAMKTDDDVSPDDLDDYDNLKKLVLTQNEGLNQLKQKLTDREKEAAQQAQRYQDLAQKEQAREGQKLLDGICTKLEETYDAQSRNEVLKVVDKKFVEGKISEMSTAAQQQWIQDTLELEYMRRQNVKPKSTSDTTDPDPQLDTGTGGTSTAVKEIPEGDFDTVFDQFVAQQKKLDGG